MYYKTVHQSPVGTLTLACDETGSNLVGLWIEGQKILRGAIRETMTRKRAACRYSAAPKWLDRYFAGGRPDYHELPLAPVGSEFRQEVWAILREIP